MTTYKLITRWFVLAGVLSAGPLLAGCNLEPSVPGSPTYTADVQPILEARCVRCHSDPQLASATPGVRFDVYECPTVDGGASCAGAKTVAPLIKMRLQQPNDDVFHMPPKPAAPLSPYQVDTVVKWVDNGAPE